MSITALDRGMAYSTLDETKGRRDILGGVGSVVHHQEFDILDVVDKEGLVAGGHHVAGLLVGTKANLHIQLSVNPISPSSVCRESIEMNTKSFSQIIWSSGTETSKIALNDPGPLVKNRFAFAHRIDTPPGFKRTEGMVMVPLKRLRTRLSIPLGLRQLALRRMNRSHW